MPKIDSITGCPVMTLPEFLAEEAAIKGHNDPGRILTEIHDEMDNESKQTALQYTDKSTCLKFIQSVCGPEVVAWDYERRQPYIDYSFFSQVKSGKWVKRTSKKVALRRPHYPVEVIDVLLTHYHQGFHQSSGAIVARVKCDDSIIRICHWEFQHFYATMMEPEDGDESVTWDVNLKKIAKKGTWTINAIPTTEKAVMEEENRQENENVEIPRSLLNPAFLWNRNNR